MRWPVALLAALVAVPSASCSPHKVTKNPAPPIPLSAAYARAGGGALPEMWWRQFGDADLARLIDKMLSGNLQLRAAWARLDQAGALARQASGSQWPQLEARLSASRQRIRSPFADAEGVPPGLPEAFTTDNFSASLAASYEIDVWARVSSQAKAAAVDALATRHDVEAIAMTLTSEVAEAWLDLVGQRAQRKLLEEQVRVSETFLELVTLRFQKGFASALDVNQQRQQLLATQAQLPLVDAAIAGAQVRVSVLLGVAPGAPVGGARDSLPELPPGPGTGIPADLLDRRPDVRSARLRAEAADYRVAAAVSARLPTLSLSGSIGKQSGEIKDIISSPSVWSIVGALVAPLWDWGIRKAEVDRNEAVVDERLATYGQVLVQAIAEVETALLQEQAQIIYVTNLTEQVEVANSALLDARERYREGLSDQGFLQVLTALQSQQRAELSLLGAQRQLLSYRIQLYRALGGSWTRSLSPRTGRKK